jgi:steroid delta-isomerase-like uncharacterized protein
MTEYRSAPAADDGIRETSLRPIREATVRKHYEAENRHDVDAMLATFSAEKASYDVPAFGEAGQRLGHAAVRDMWAEILAVFPDIHHEVERLSHGDDFVLVEYRVSGTQHADWAGIPATGRSFSIRVAAVYEFEGDELVCERAYTDLADWLRQLGGAGLSAAPTSSGPRDSAVRRPGRTSLGAGCDLALLTVGANETVV